MIREPSGGDELDALKFVGAVTASVSHELNNVITIIDQVGGLLQDTLAGARAGAPLDMGRLQSMQERIARQTRRGIEIVKNLNRFAHGVDEPVAQFEVNAVVANLVSLVQRLAELKKVRLSVRYAGRETYVTSSPFRLQQAVFHCLERFLQCAPPGGEIALAITCEGSSACVAVSGPAVSADEDWRDRLAGVLQVAHAPPARISLAGGEATEIRIEMPARH